MQRTTITWVAIGAGALAIVSVVALAFVLISQDDKEPEPVVAATTPTEPERVRLPRVTDRSLVAARRELRQLGFKTKVRRRRYNDEEKGTVLSQMPRPGAQLRRGTTVLMAVSRGPEPPKTPYGPLGTSSIGPVKVGMGPDEVARYFVAPDDKQDVNFGAGETPQIDWIYRLGDGELRLQFAVAGDKNELTGYTTSSSTFATVSGYKVGGSITPVIERYGDQLSDGLVGECSIGGGSCLLSEGEPSTYPGITFTFSNGTITDISGGEFQPAGD